MTERVIQSFGNTKTKIISVQTPEGTKKVAVEKEGLIEENKIRPLLSSSIPIKPLPISLCSNLKVFNAITLRVANLNRDFSEFYKTEVIYRELGLNTQKEKDEYFSQFNYLYKEDMYKRFNICRKNTFAKFSIEKLQEALNRCEKVK